MAAPLYYVRRDEDWIRHASTVITASGNQTDYEPEKIQTDDPAEPFWSSATTATVTVAFGATREVGILAIIMNNAGDGEVITLGGGLSGHTLTGARELTGFPRDIALIIEPPVNITGFTLDITTNEYPVGTPLKWSIGTMVAGKRRSIENLLDGLETRPSRSVSVDEGIDGHLNTLKYDVGVDHWEARGELLLTKSDTTALYEWHASNKYGTHPTLFVPDLTLYPPMWGYLDLGPKKAQEGNFRIPVTFVTAGRGLEVIG